MPSKSEQIRAMELKSIDEYYDDGKEADDVESEEEE